MTQASAKKGFFRIEVGDEGLYETFYNSHKVTKRTKFHMIEYRNNNELSVLAISKIQSLNGEK